MLQGLEQWRCQLSTSICPSETMPAEAKTMIIQGAATFATRATVV